MKSRRNFLKLVVSAAVWLRARCMAAGGGPTGKVLVRFNFAGPMPPTLAPGPGEWTVKDGILAQSAKSDKTSLVRMDVAGETNYRVQARVRMQDVAPGAIVGIAARIQPDGSCYLLCLYVRSDGRKTIQLLRGNPDAPDPCILLQGEHKSIFVADNGFIDEADLAQWHQLTLDCRGHHFVGYFDGRQVVSYSFGIEAQLVPPLWAAGPPGLCTQKTRAQFDDVAVWALVTDRHMATLAHGLHDANGRLLPRLPYAEYLERLMNYQINVKQNVLLVPGEGTFKLLDESFEVTPHGFKDATGHVWPSYCINSYVHGNNFCYWQGDATMIGSIWGVTAFPLIEGLLNYYAYSGDPQCLELAREAGDWLIKTRRPSGSPLALVPRTLILSNYQGEKFEDMAYGVPLAARAWVKLYAVSGDQKYLNAAIAVGNQLLRLQLPEGSWKAFYDAKTGEAKDTQPSDWLFQSIALMEDLGYYTNEPKWLETRDRALNSCLEGSLRTMTFRGPGHCGDAGPNSNMVCCMAFVETLRYFIRHLPQRPEYREIVVRLHDFALKSKLITRDYLFPGGCGIQEIANGRDEWGFGGFFTMQYAGPYARLHEVTAEPLYKSLAFDLFNTSTYFQFADGKIRQSMWIFLGEWPVLAPTGATPAIEFMSVFPETAPKAENHMLRWSSEIQSIRYKRHKIAYRTFAGGEEMLKVGEGTPAAVLVNGKQLPKMEKLQPTHDGWYYTRHSKILRVQHSGCDVEISLE